MGMTAFKSQPTSVAVRAFWGWSTAEPVVSGWLRENLGPVGKIQDAGRALNALSQFAANLPAVLLQTEKIISQVESMAEDGFELSESALAKLSEAQARGARLGHIALWLLVIILIVFILR